MSPLSELVDRPRPASAPAHPRDRADSAPLWDDTLSGRVAGRLTDSADWSEWDGDWSAEGSADDGADHDTPTDQTPPSSPRRRLDLAGLARLPGAAALTRRRPPARRAPLLLAAAVLGAVLTTLFSGLGHPGSPVSSASDYGLGADAETSFAGGVDATARSEVSQAEAAQRLSTLTASRASRAPQYVLPTQGRLSTCFCTRWGTMHWGIDLAAPLGTPIYAATDGVVLRAGPASGYGNAIYIQDADGNVEIYGHMRYYNVKAGDVVSAGDQIAKVGNQGFSTGPHLHFEIHVGGVNGTPTDPQKWLTARGVTVN